MTLPNKPTAISNTVVLVEVNLFDPILPIEKSVEANPNA